MLEMVSKTQGSRPRSRTQKNPRPRPRTALPRTDPLEVKNQGHRRKCSQKVGVFKSFFQAISNKRSSKFFFQAICKRGKQKTSSLIFRQVSGLFQQNFNGSKNSAVLGPRTGQFLRTEASRRRPRTSK